MGAARVQGRHVQGGRVRGGRVRGCGLAAALAEAVRGGLAAARLGRHTLLLALLALDLALLCTRHVMLLQGFVCWHAGSSCALVHTERMGMPASQPER